MLTFRQLFVEGLVYKRPKVVFHETTIAAAIKILQTGRIKGKFVDDPKAQKSTHNDELDSDYGFVVYTSAMHCRDDYCGVHQNDVMFVIDANELDGNYEPNVEGGLLTVPLQISISKVVHIHISDDGGTSDKYIGKVMQLARQNNIPVTMYATKSREQVIMQFRK